MVDIDAVAVEKANKRIGQSIQRVAKKKFADDAEGGQKFVADSIGRISTSTDAVAAVASSDLVVEAIVENMGVKKKLFSQLDEVRLITSISYLYHNF